MGPGLVLKTLLQGSFSLMIFGWTQIIMDIQPLIVIISGEGHLHGFSHTYVGASLLAVVAALTGKRLSEYGLIVLGISDRAQPVRIAWWVVFLSAYIGAGSHVLLDSVIHSDLYPYYPFNNSNPMLGIISVETLHKFCIYSGLLGAVGYYLTEFMLKRRQAIKTE